MNKSIFLLALLFCSLKGVSQVADSIKRIDPVLDTTTRQENKKSVVSGAVSVTNNGISLVPAFSLEKPAAIFDISIKKKKFSFEPEFALGFEDIKPWYFVFWFRYKLIETSKFNLGVGFHPGFLFSTTNIFDNGVSKEYFTTARFFVGALTPSYTIAKDISVGVYYQYSRGYNIDLKQSQFLGANLNFSNISLGSKFYIKAAPQVYYLRNDEKDGFYANASITLAKRNLPFSVSTLLNKKLQSEIPSKNFLWNISFTYSY